MRLAAVLLANVAVTGAGILAYHLAVAHVAPAAQEDATPAAPASPSPAAPSPSGLAPLGVAPSFARFEAMERRIASLERALANAATLVPGAPPASPAGAPAPGASPVWTEDQLAAFRAMLAEVSVRKEQEQYAATMRGVLATASKEPIPEERKDRAVALLAAFQRKVRELFPDGMGGTTEEQRRATNESAQRARDALEEEIRRMLPADAADRVMSMVPSFPGRLPADTVLPPMR